MKKLFYILIMLLFFASCEQKGKLNTIDEESKQQSELVDAYRHVDSLMRHAIIDTDACNAFIEKALVFYRDFPEESITPKMLWSAAITSMNYAKYTKDISTDAEIVMDYARKSIQIFDIIQKVYPDYENTKSTYLYKGMIYGDILDDYEKARNEHLQYISKYPNDSEAQNFKEYIEYLGVSSDEIYKSFNVSE